MRHAVTPKVERVVRDLRAISREIEPQMHLVSQAARDEWTAVQAAWPSDEDLRQGTTALTEDELEDLEIKVRRFRGIVQSLSVGVTLVQTAPVAGRQRTAASEPSSGVTGDGVSDPQSWFDATRTTANRERAIRFRSNH